MNKRQFWTAVLVPISDPIWGQLKQVRLTHPNLLGLSQPELFDRLFKSRKFAEQYAGYELVDLF